MKTIDLLDRKEDLDFLKKIYSQIEITVLEDAVRHIQKTHL